jgi:hypothetical protein
MSNNGVCVNSGIQKPTYVISFTRSEKIRRYQMSRNDPLAHVRDEKEAPPEKQDQETAEFVKNGMKGLTFLLCGGVLMAVGGGVLVVVGIVVWLIIQDVRQKKKEKNSHPHVPLGINCQVGNLDQPRHEAMMRAGVQDSKVMATDRALYHGTGDKVLRQKIPADMFDKVYPLMQTPERIYENTEPKYKQFGREFHFVQDTQDGKVLKVVLRQQNKNTALEVTTMGWVENDYDDTNRYKKIWPPPGGI